MFDYSGRLYTFGCSMTRYHYPTWADILGKEFSYYENWGRGGHGNLFIFNSVIECLARNQLTSNDTIIVMWSAISRYDYYKINEWCIENDTLRLPKHFVCPYGNEVRDYAYFYALYNLLESKHINFKFLAWHPYAKDSVAGNIYKSVLDKISIVNFDKLNKRIIEKPILKLELLYNRLAGSEWPSLQELLDKKINSYPLKIKQEVEEFYSIINKNRYEYVEEKESDAVDLHPGPLQHLTGLQTIFPTVALSKTTIDWIADIDHKVQNKLPYNFNEFAKATPKERF